ncbi:MAG: serine/threonine protein phosphatase [Paenibacillus macerans]|uniref:metallophosphoesterase family protein n=1 Tax=Paenibacillus macerans TaxID=44252 RepID=UPI0024300868|nr:metallophosphoesterase family protein [Paenibacillus macerans]MBS5913104.1 serine/threonine protein phosphatase [Paenibacillus macerans]
MKYFMTDIHGDCFGMELLLRHAEIDFSKDQLVFGGDMINRGKESAKVVRKIKELADAHPNNVHVLIGNHEEMMSDYFQNGDKLWHRHGGKETLMDFERTFSKAEMKDYVEWIINLPLILEDNEFVYTHAGLNPNEPLHNQSRDILWMTEYDFYSIPKENLLNLTHNKPIIHGHTPVERIYFDGARLNADMGSNTYFVEEERGLGLLNLTEMYYCIFKQSSKKIEKRKVAQF